jgi:hypothetical protein
VLVLPPLAPAGVGAAVVAGAAVVVVGAAVVVAGAAVVGAGAAVVVVGATVVEGEKHLIGHILEPLVHQLQTLALAGTGHANRLCVAGLANWSYKAHWWN